MHKTETNINAKFKLMTFSGIETRFIPFAHSLSSFRSNNCGKINAHTYLSTSRRVSNGLFLLSPSFFSLFLSLREPRMYVANPSSGTDPCFRLLGTYEIYFCKSISNLTFDRARAIFKAATHSAIETFVSDLSAHGAPPPRERSL